MTYRAKPSNTPAFDNCLLRDASYQKEGNQFHKESYATEFALRTSRTIKISPQIQVSETLNASVPDIAG